MTDHPTLQRRLRDAADPSAWPDVSPDAWQQNERRVAADESRRGGRRLRVVAAAAAVVLVIGAGAYAANQLGGTPSLAPAQGKDPVRHRTQVGSTVTLESFRVQGSLVVHSAYLSRSGDKGLSLCDEYASPSTRTVASMDGCTVNSPGASDPKVDAFVLLTGLDSRQFRGVTGAVTGAVGPLVASLKAWVGDSPQARDVPLVALGIDGLQAFGVTTVGTHAPVVRLVAYDENGAVFRALDPPDHQGAPPLAKQCAAAQVSRAATGTVPRGTSLALAADAVRISAAAGPTACLPLNSLAYAPVGPRTVLVVVPPEAVNVTVRSATGSRAAPLIAFGANPWRFAVVTAPTGSQLERLRVVLTDATGQELGAATVGHRLFTSP